MKFIGGHLDFFGFSASMICALHCMAIPLMVAFGASAGLVVLDHAFIEWGMLLLSGVIVMAALWKGYKSHKQQSIIFLGGLGISVLLLSHLLHDFGEGMHYLAAVGGLIIAFTHYLNWRKLSCKVI